MKKIIFILLPIFLFAALAVPVSHAKLTKDERKKRVVERFCNIKWFKDKGYFDLYQTDIEVIGIEKTKIGKLKKRWMCHWRPKPNPTLQLNYEHWWSTRNTVKKEPYRILEHHYDAGGHYGDNSYSDTWIMKDPVTKKRQRCQNFHEPEKTYSGKAPVVNEICADL